MKHNRIEKLWEAYARKHLMDEQPPQIQVGLRVAFAAGAAAALREAEAHGDEFDVPIEWVRKFAGEAEAMLGEEATK
jgi:hypothetical protein